MKIQFLFYIIRIILMTLQNMPLVTLHHLSFSCRDIVPIFAGAIVSETKKWEMEDRASSRSESSRNAYFTLQRDLDRHLVGESQRIDFVTDRIESIADITVFNI
jgi:hypothetical protein